MARRDIGELLRVPGEEHDLDWLHDSLQWAVELEFATIPLYLSGMWSIKEQSGPVQTLIDSVVLEEMLHLGLACNMLAAIGGMPQITPPTYPTTGLPGGVRPDLHVALGGLSPAALELYMQIELPENPLARVDTETFPTIGAFYDAISAAFTALAPPISTAKQVALRVRVPDPDQPENPDAPRIVEERPPLATLADVQSAITLIKDQGEGTSQSPDAPEFGGELAHYYRFGEILHGHKLIKVGDRFEFTGPSIPFPDCFPVATVPPGGYPGVDAVAQFDLHFKQLVKQLQDAWSKDTGIGPAIRTMFGLSGEGTAIAATPLPGGGGNLCADFVVANAAPG